MIWKLAILALGALLFGESLIKLAMSGPIAYAIVVVAVNLTAAAFAFWLVETRVPFGIKRRKEQ